jgi:lipoyl(octanoyl) transferase
MRIVNWGLTPYLEAQRRQLELVEEVASGADEVLIFCTHPPVVTVGRGTQADDIFAWQGELVETSRGGRATYHGPNQIVVYPILNLAREQGKTFGARDIHAYLRVLEMAIVKTLNEFGLAAEARTVRMGAEGPSLTGVWIGSKKVASIGIAVKKWVTYHGLALNVFRDEHAFRGINPCGFKSEIMTSMEAEKGMALNGEEVGRVLEKHLRQAIEGVQEKPISSYQL